LYFPVPTIRRDSNARPAITKASIAEVYCCPFLVVRCRPTHLQTHETRTSEGAGFAG
jgi:hypothetical protein